MAAIDYSRGLIGQPASNAAAVSVHDVNELDAVPRAIYVGGAGDMKVTMYGGEEVTFVGVAGGTVLPIRVKKIFSTGTSATNMIALW
jgi:hypothetical protein